MMFNKVSLHMCVYRGERKREVGRVGGKEGEKGEGEEGKCAKMLICELRWRVLECSLYSSFNYSVDLKFFILKSWGKDLISKW